MNKQQYIVNVEDRNYNVFTLNNIHTPSDIITDIHPFEKKLFHNDIVEIDDEKNISIIESPVRKKPYITGILILSNNKMFGRTNNKKKTYYKCIPHDKTMSTFFIPFHITHEFIKIQTNKYIVFTFKEWTTQNMYPIATLVETIGNTNDLTCYYQYEYYNYLLKHYGDIKCSLKPMTKYITSCLKKPFDYSNKNYESPQEKLKNDEFIFTIDNKNTVEFDDAMSITSLSNNMWSIKIYITNVAVLFFQYNMWDYFPQRVSSMYFPDRKIAMFPFIFTDMCSLKENTNRHVFVFEYIIDSLGIIVSRQLLNDNLVTISKNFSYESVELLQNSSFQLLKNVTPVLHNQNSKDIVEYWMKQTNELCCDIFKENPQYPFIYRELTCNTNNENIVVPSQIKYWCNKYSGSYTFEPKEYTHFTSPMRRLVDFINQIYVFQLFNGCTIQKLLNNVDVIKINEQMKDIRKIQIQTNLLHQFKELFDNETKITSKGIVFDKIPKYDNNKWKYMVYLYDICGIDIEHLDVKNTSSSLKMKPIDTNVQKDNKKEDEKKGGFINSFSSNVELENFSIHKFRVFFFQNEENTKRKIKIVLLDI